MPHGPYQGESIFDPMLLHPAPPGLPTTPNGCVDICALITPQTTTKQRTRAGDERAERLADRARFREMLKPVLVNGKLRPHAISVVAYPRVLWTLEQCSRLVSDISLPSLPSCLVPRT